MDSPDRLPAAGSADAQLTPRPHDFAAIEVYPGRRPTEARSGDPLQRATVKKQIKAKKKPKEGEEEEPDEPSRPGFGTYVPAELGDTGAIDTTTLTLQERQAILEQLKKRSGWEKKKDFKRTIEELQSEINLFLNPIDDEEIAQLGVTLSKLSVKAKKTSGLDKEDGVVLQQATVRLLSAFDLLGGLEVGDKSIQKYRAAVLSLIDRVNSIDTKALKKASALGGRQQDLTVSGGEKAAYREDIKSGGVWGGGAEASAVALGTGMYLDLFILDSDGKYLKVDTIGAGGGTQSNYSLVNLGNHYVAVSNTRAPGDNFEEVHISHNPDGDGDCMFNALYYCLSNGGGGNVVYTHPTTAVQTTMGKTQFVTGARDIASKEISDTQVTLSVQEILLSGQSSGVGANLGKLVDLRKYDQSKLQSLVSEKGVKESELLSKINYKGKKLSEVLAQFDKVKTSKPEIANKFLDSMLKAVFELQREGDVLKSKQSRELELGLRREARRKYTLLHKVTPVGKQLIVKTTEGEFVLDRIGQLVPKTVVRGISDFNEAELKADSHIYPSAMSPVPDDKSGKYASTLKAKYSKETSTTGSGIGDNKLKATDEMLHVEGKKPSSYLSVTAHEAGTKNPQGETFGSSVYEIDLSLVAPEHIAALYTDRGMSYYLLANFTESSESTMSSLVSNAAAFGKKQESNRALKKKKPSTKEYSATESASEDSRLSGKEWQALMDVIRTKEILINCPIPAKALTKK